MIVEGPASADSGVAAICRSVLCATSRQRAHYSSPVAT